MGKTNNNIYICVTSGVTNKKGNNMGNNKINLANDLINIINTARENALKKVNEELISMYWKVGEYLHLEAQKSTFGDSSIDSVAKEIQFQE